MEYWDKMDIYLVNFTTRDEDFPEGKAPHLKYSGIGQTNKANRAESLGITPVKWNSTSLKETEFYKENMSIFSHSRGYGFWLWKPFIIKDLLDKTNSGDMVVYLDAGSDKNINSNIFRYIDICKNNSGFFFVKSHHSNGRFIKRDCYHYMDMDTDAARQSEMVHAAFMIFENNDFVKNIVKEWLGFCSDRRILTDDGNRCGLEDHPEFEDHRHDQSVISLLKLKYGIKDSGFFFEEI